MTRFISINCVIAGLLLACISMRSLGNDNSYHLITHPSTTTTSLSLGQVRSVFSLRARDWPNGAQIKLVVLKDNHPVHKNFLKERLGMLPHQLRRQWDRIIYSGTGQGPLIVNSIEEMVNKVKSLPGSIGYSDGKELNGVQVLQIN